MAKTAHTFHVDGLELRTHAMAPNTMAVAERPVLIVHGIGVSHRYSDRLQSALSRTRPTFSLDLPGFAGTEKPSARLSVEDYAAVIAVAADELGVRGATVIGHSMGAQFASELARIRPEIVSEVVLAGPVVDPERRSVLMQSLDLAHDIVGEPPSVNLIVLTDYLRCGPRWFFTELAAMLEFSTEDAVARLTQPVLVVRGENDPIARRAWCEQLTDSAADGRLIELPDSRHVVQHNSAERMAEEVLSFSRIASADPRPS
jgi:pimeloyl-ACP methyl ester carboxylesterase